MDDWVGEGRGGAKGLGSRVVGYERGVLSECYKVSQGQRFSILPPFSPQSPPFLFPSLKSTYPKQPDLTHISPPHPEPPSEPSPTNYEENPSWTCSAASLKITIISGILIISVPRQCEIFYFILLVCLSSVSCLVGYFILFFFIFILGTEGRGKREM